jgi:hypothetical protein
MFRHFFTAAALNLLTWPALAAPAPSAQPTEVKIVSVPAAQPTEVKIVSTPPASPAEVKIVSAPESPTERALVTVTWGLLIANVLLCAATFYSTDKQSKDLRLRDRRAIVREVNGVAHKVMVSATRLKQLASEVPTTRNHLHELLHQGGMPDPIKAETESLLHSRNTALDEMVETASASSAQFHDLEALSDEELSQRLWTLDVEQVRLEAMEDTITHELRKYETEISVLRQQNTTMHAATLNAQMSRPPKKLLGE